MAKQSGLHQLRGKVGEHSYYRQTGIVPGLVRSINQGLSARVKTGAEYANTRLNNVEFGGAADVAGILGKMVTPKFRPMILPFSQSTMAKKVLELARQSGGSWGQRVVTADDTAQLAEILSVQSKRAYDEFASVTLTRSSASSLAVTAGYSSEQATLMSGLGIDHLSVSVAYFDVATGKFNSDLNKINKGYANLRDIQAGFLDSDVSAGEGDSASGTITITGWAPNPNWYNAHRFVVFVVMPGRTINGVTHILQEYCSFVAFEVPAED